MLIGQFRNLLSFPVFFSSLLHLAKTTTTKMPMSPPEEAAKLPEPKEYDPELRVCYYKLQ